MAALTSPSPAPDPTPDRTAEYTPTPAELAHRAKDEARDIGYERAAQFLLLLDTNDAASVLGSLNVCEVLEICRVIVTLQEIDIRDARHVVEEFGVPAAVIRTSAHGGPQAARRLLTAAFDEERAEYLFNRMPAPATL